MATDTGITETVSAEGAAYTGRNADVYARALGAVNKTHAPDESAAEAARMAAHRNDIDETRAAQRTAAHEAEIATSRAAISPRAAFTEAAAPASGAVYATPNADGTQSLPEVTISAKRPGPVTHELALRDANPRPATDNPNYVATVTVPDKQPEPVAVAEAPAPVVHRAPVEVAKPVTVARQMESRKEGRALKDIFLTLMGAQSGNFRRDDFMQQMYPIPQKKPDSKGPTLGR